MSMSMLRFHSLDGLLLQRLTVIYDAQSQWRQAAGVLAKAASAPDLGQAFSAQESEAAISLSSLEKVFELLGGSAERMPSQAMAGLVAECLAVAQAQGEAKVRDAALIAAAQCAQQYKITSCRTLEIFAQQLGKLEAAQVLKRVLTQETAAQDRLALIARAHVNIEARDAA